MSQIAHIRNTTGTWEIVRRYDLDSDGKAVGRIKDETGKTLVEMPVVGMIFPNDRIVPLTEETVDNSTGSDINVTENTVVTDTGVTILKTITDKTQQEIDEEQTSKAAAIRNRTEGQLHKLALAGIFWLVNDVRSRHGQAAITADTFLSALDNYASQFDDAKFIAKIKEVLND